MNVPMLLLVFVVAIVVPLEAQFLKCYNGKRDGKEHFVGQSKCRFLDDDCAKRVCDVNGTVKVVAWGCAKEVCDLPGCFCFKCSENLCNNDQLPQTTTTEVSTTLTTENPPVAEENGALGIGGGPMSAFALTTVAAGATIFLAFAPFSGLNLDL